MTHYPLSVLGDCKCIAFSQRGEGRGRRKGETCSWLKTRLLEIVHLPRQPQSVKKHLSKGSFFEESSEKQASPYHKLPRCWHPRSPEWKNLQGRTTVEEESKSEGSVQARFLERSGNGMSQQRLLKLRKLSSRLPKSLYKGRKDKSGHLAHSY